MITKGRGWIEALSNNDAEALSSKLFNLISKHSSVRMLYSHDGLCSDSRTDLYSDLTQALYLRMLEKGRWKHYLDLGYSDEKVEQELYRIEVPNLISDLQRERYPEAYRLARRISELVKTKPEFRLYPNQLHSSSQATPDRPVRGSNKMVLKVYGLSSWPADKEVSRECSLEDLIKDVPFRSRDTRRTGRGSGSQIVISNEELTQLMVDIFIAVDTPLTVRKVRRLVMSKLAVEDSHLFSLDATLVAASDQMASLPKIDPPDQRPTPLENILASELKQQVEILADDLLKSMREAVRNKPQRYRKLVGVVWHCYFNPASPSQTRIAKIIGISDSLVSHYRGIFDTLIRSLDLNIDGFILLNTALSNRLTAVKAEMASGQVDREVAISEIKLKDHRAISVGVASCRGSQFN